MKRYFTLFGTVVVFACTLMTSQDAFSQYATASHLGNISQTATHTVTCPILRESFGTSKIDEVQIAVFNRGSSRDLPIGCRCSLSMNTSVPPIVTPIR